MKKEVPQQEFAVTSIEDLKQQYPNLSQEDIDFYLPSKKILDFESENISLRKYESLIQKQKELNNYNAINPDENPKTLSEKELSQIYEFENRNKKSPESFEKEIDYWDKLYSETSKEKSYADGLIPDKKTLYKLFLEAYKCLNGVEFIITEESIRNIEPIIKYFSFDKEFEKSENLVINCGNKKLLPSFKKGLLLVGNVGNGKTSIMKSMEFLINFYFKKSIEEKWNTSGDWFRIKFKLNTTEGLVSDFEYLKTQEEKDLFFKKNETGNIMLDDLKREKNASNYGITNVVASLLEKRYNHLKKYTSNQNDKIFVTHGTMNFHAEYPNKIDFAIQECGLRYGSHVYDRMFEMFNIVEIKGKSFRK